MRRNAARQINDVSRARSALAIGARRALGSVSAIGSHVAPLTSGRF
jgi:hypothetical protein